MRKFTKSIALLLAVIMVAGLLVACGGDSGSNGGSSAGLDVDPATLKFPLAEKATIAGLTSFPVGTESNPNNRTIFKRLEEATNVHVEWKSIQSDQWGDKITLEMSNAKTLPEFVFSAGFSDQEREKMTALLESGFKDSFRELYPEEVKYSWWSYRTKARERGVGWRIDYFVVSARLMDKIKDSLIYDEIMGSDHCPVGLRFE